MISTKINAEITAYQEKLFLGLSLRQLVCFALAAALAIATAVVGHFTLHINMDILSYIIMVEVLPFLGLGFIRRGGYSFEKLVAIYWRWYNENPHIPVKPYKECYNDEKKNRSGRKQTSECQTTAKITKKVAKKRKKAACKSIAAAKKETRQEPRRRRKAGKAQPKPAEGGRLPTI